MHGGEQQLTHAVVSDLRVVVHRQIVHRLRALRQRLRQSVADLVAQLVGGQVQVGEVPHEGKQQLAARVGERGVAQEQRVEPAAAGQRHHGAAQRIVEGRRDGVAGEVEVAEEGEPVDEGQDLLQLVGGEAEAHELQRLERVEAREGLAEGGEEGGRERRGVEDGEGAGGLPDGGVGEGGEIVPGAGGGEREHENVAGVAELVHLLWELAQGDDSDGGGERGGGDGEVGRFGGRDRSRRSLRTSRQRSGCRRS